MSRATSSGLFMPVIDWSDPIFAEWRLSKLAFNKAQREMFLTHDLDDGLLDLTIEQRKELCLALPCKVELFHSNVCAGVEQSWPKRMFGQDDFQSLSPEQKQQINAKMQRNGVMLYKKYVDENALAERLQHQTNAALEPYLELNYWKNLFQRMQALENSPMEMEIDINHNVKNASVFWKKETCNNDSMYADPFDSIKIECKKQWHDELNALKSPRTVQCSRKCNIEAHKLMQNGDTAYSAGNWNEAMNEYNQALRFAEPDTVCEGLAYGNRGKCFYQLRLYHDALIDFKLADQKKCPDQFLNDTHELRVNCQKEAKRRYKVKTKVPKMKLLANPQFPCMANVLDIKFIEGYGRCVVANADIKVGETIVVAETFASVTMAHNQAYCYTCQCTDQMNFIPCANCSDVMFCDEKCANNNSIHKIECQTSYHRIDSIDVKFIIHTVLVAIDMFPSVDDLIKFVESCILDRDYDEIPKSANDSTSKYGLFLNLAPSYDDKNLLFAYKAFTCILLVPKIKLLFDSESKQRFLMQLIVHHANAIPKNAFLDSDQHAVKDIYDVLSIVNHSCAPNMGLTVDSKFGHGVSLHNIKKGEQVFIDYYFCDDLNMPTDQRQQVLQDNWGFDCKCKKCEAGSNEI